MPLKYLYPECEILLQGSPSLTPLHCLQNDACPSNRNCMENLAKRVNFFFGEVEPQTELIVAYFKQGESIKAGLFNKDLEEPRLITCNRSAFQKCYKEGITYKWDPPLNFYMLSTTTDIIKPETLIR